MNNMISSKNLQTFNTIRDLINQKGFAPTIKEIAVARKLSPTAITKHINQLLRANVIAKEPGKKSGTLRIII